MNIFYSHKHRAISIVLKKTASVFLLFLQFLVAAAIPFSTGLTFGVKTADAQATQQINYQGKLTNGAGVNVTDGTYNMEFKLYASSTGGSALWTETRTSANKVQVTDGLFSVMLGSVSGLTSVDFNQPLYLGVNIGGSGTPTWDGEMSPRKTLGSVPSAFVAKTLEGVRANQFIRNDIINSTSSSGTPLRIEQAGAGGIAEFIANSSSTLLGLYTTSGGQMTVGTSTAQVGAKLTVAGAAALLGTTTLALQNGVVAIGAAADATSKLNVTNAGSLTNIANFLTNASVSVLTITNAGNVGVGSSTPSAKFAVTGSGTGTGRAFAIANSSNVDKFTVLDNGDVTAMGSVNLPTDGSAIRFANSGANGTITSSGGLLTISNGAGSAAADSIVINTSAAGRQLSMRSDAIRFSNYNNATEYGRFTSTGSLGIGTTTPGSLLTVAGTGLFTGATTFMTSSGVVNGQFLRTNMNGTGNSGIRSTVDGQLELHAQGVQVMTVFNNGNVAIGTSSALAKLHIQSSAASSYVTSDGSGITGVNSGSTRYEIVQNGSSAYGLTTGSAVDGGVLRLGIGAGNSYISGGQQGSAIFNVFVGATSSPKLTINTSGNVGIGTTTPGDALTVAGAFNLTGALEGNGNAGTLGQILQTTGSAVTWVSTSTLGFLGSSITASLSNGLVPRWNGTTFVNSIMRENGTVAGINATSSSVTFNVQGTAGINPFNIASSSGTSLVSVDQSGRLGIGMTAAETLDVNGDIRQRNSRTFTMSRTLPTTLNDAVDIGSLSLTNGAGAVWVTVVVPSGGYSVSKQYLLPIKYAQTSGAWTVAAPISDTGAYSGNNFALDINVNNSTASLRLRNTGGATVGTAYIVLRYEGVNTDTFTASTATGSSTAPSTLFTGTALTQVGGNVAIGTTTANDLLTVAGALNLTGMMKANGSAGTAGQILQTTGTGTAWVSTSSLAINTTNLIEGSNLFYTDARARSALSETTTGLDYATSTGILSLTSGYNIPLTASTTNWGTFYDTPSSRITAGTGLAWAGNTLNAVISTSSLNYLRLVSGGLETSTTTDYLRAAFVVASSTTATSTFAGGLTVGTNNFVVTQSGNVGIGTSSPTARFAIVGAGGTNPFTVASSSNSAMFTVAANGNVGIGTNAPAGTLHLYSSSTGAFPSMLMGGNSGTDTDFWFARVNDGDNIDDDSLQFGDGLVPGTNPFVTINTNGYVGIGTTTPGAKLEVADAAALQLRLRTTGTSLNYWDLGRSAVDGSFRLADGSTDRFTINSSGNVGIGTTTPNSKLQVYTGNTANANEGITLSRGSGQDLFGFKHRSDGSGIYRGAITYNSTESMSFLQSGNVGIGTTTPSDTFSVAGSFNLTGALRSNGNAGTAGQLLMTTGSGTAWLSTSSLAINTSNLVEGSNLFYTDARARSSITDSVVGVDYATSTGIFTLTSGYNIPLTASTTEWAFNTPTNIRGMFSNTSTGLTYTAATGVTSLTAGYNIPLTASTTNWGTFYDTPSARITAGTNLSWAGNTLNATVAVSTSSINYLRLVSGGLETSTTTDYLRAAFFTATSSTATSTFAGAVGIGTTTPRFKLDVQSLGSSVARFYKSDAVSDPVNALLVLEQGGTGDASVDFLISGGQRWRAGVDNSDSDKFKISSGADYGTSTKLVITTAGNVGIGSSTPVATLGIGGTLNVSGGATFMSSVTLGGDVSFSRGAANRFDLATGDSLNIVSGALQFAGSAGTNGQILQTTGSTAAWVSTSTLGLGNGTFLGLADTISSYNAGRILFESGSGIVDSASLVFTGTNLGIGTSTPSDTLSVAGSFNLTGALRANGNSGIAGQLLMTTGSGTQWLSTSSLAINSTNLVEGSNLFYTDARARAAFSETTTGLDYATSTGVVSLTAGYSIPLTASSTEWAIAYASTTALTPNFIRGLFSNTVPGLTYNTGTGATSLTAGYNIPLTASTTNWGTFYDTPSARITAGTNLSWAGNTLNATVAVSTSSLNYLRLVSGGLETSTTTDYLRAAFIVASSTTATSTFAGAVGIGTASPLFKLDVQSLGSSVARFYKNDSVADPVNALLVLEQGGSGDASIDFLISGAQRWRAGVDNSDSDKFKISSGADYGTSTKLVITTAGNVGIGSSTPVATLGVAGTVNITGAATFLSSINIGSDVSLSRGATQRLDLATGDSFNIVSGALQIAGVTAIDSARNANFATSVTLGSDVVFSRGAANRFDLASGDSLNIVSGALQFAGSAGTAGQILQTTGSTAAWVSTSTLGLGNNTFLGLADTVSSYNAGRILFESASGVTDSSSLVFSNGNLGIGTTPIATLDVQNALSATNSPIAILGRGIGDPNFILSTKKGGVANVSGIVSVAFGLSYGTTTQNTNIKFHRGSSTTGGFLSFTTNDDTERLRIDAAGNVGIGTTTAGSMLTVAGAINSTSYASAQQGFYINASSSNGTSNGINNVLGGNTLSFRTGGTDNRMVIDGSGNVGIGTSSPSALLSLGTAVTTIKIAAYDGGPGALYGIGVNSGQLTFGANIAANGTPQMVLTNAGYVGIGTTSPNSLLSVQSGALDNSASSDRAFTAVFASPNKTLINGTNSGQVAIIANDGSPTADYGGTLSFGAKYNTAGAVAINAAVRSGRDDGTSSSYGGYLSLITRPNGGSLTERLRITSTGNVGIGTTSPVAKLQVVASGALFNGALTNTFAAGADGNTGAVTLSYDSALNTGVIQSISPGTAWRTLALQGLDFKFYNASNAEMVRITNTGNVGIGTTTPVAKLDVAGSIKVGDSSGSISVPSNVALYVRGAGSSASAWKGRIVAGGDNVAFLMGEYNSQAWLGGHNAALNAWAPLRINPDGTADLYLGNTNGGGAGVAPIITVRNSAGDVGIGTTSPTDTLSVAGSLNLTGAFKANSSAGTNGQVLQTTVTGTRWVSTSTLGLGTGTFLGLSDTISSYSAGRLLFQSGSSVTDSSTLVYSNGSLGIGTASPTGTLTIASSSSGVVSPSLRLESHFDAGSGAKIVFDSIGNGSERASIGYVIGGGGAGNLTFATQGSERLRIDGTGNVGIGTTTPTRLLSVNGNAQFGTNVANLTATPLNVSFGADYGSNTPGDKGNLKWDMFTNAADGNRYGIGMSAGLMEIQAGVGGGIGMFTNQGATRAMDILSNGRIGIGTAAPVTNLDVTGAGVVTTGTAYTNFAAYQDHTNYRGITLGYDTAGQIGTFFSGTSGASSEFSWVSYNGSAWTEKMRLGTTGNLGIGDTTPTAKLTVGDGGNTMPIGTSIISSGTGAATSSTILDNRLFLAIGGNYDYGSYLGVLNQDGGSSGVTGVIGTRGNGFDGAAIFIKNGTVGIGTTTPSDTFSVAGSFNLTGALRSNGNAGTAGQLLMTTGSGTAWLSTSSLAINTSNLVEGSNLFYTDARARSSITDSVVGVDYATSTGIFTLTSGYNIPLTASTTQWASAFASTTATTPTYIRSLFSDTTTGITYTPATGVSSLTAGYVIPLTASTTQWASAFASTTALTPTYIRSLSSNTATGLTYTAATGATALTAGYVIPLTASTTQWAAAFASTTALTPTYIRNQFSESATGIDYTAATGLFSLTSGYEIPLAASTSNWTSFFNTPSTRITAGSNLAWSGNTLNAALSTSSINYWRLGNGTMYTGTTTDNVAIGTTTPNGKLHVSGGNLLVTSAAQSQVILTAASGASGSGFQIGRSALSNNAQDFFIYDSVAGQFRMNIDSSGNVGIGGQSVPTAKLDVIGGGVKIGTNAVANNTDGALSIGNTTANYTPTSGNWSGAGTTMILNGLDYSTIGFHDASARVDFIRTGAGVMQLGYDGGWGEAAIRLPGSGIWNNNGKVGIGTTTPATALVVMDSTSVGSFTGNNAQGIRVSGAGNGTYSLVQFMGNQQTPGAQIGAYQNNSAGSTLTFGTSNNYATGITNAAMAIDPSGRVGIGTTTPLTKLVVSDTGAAKLNLTGGTSQNGMTFSSVAGADEYYLYNGDPFGNGGNFGIYNNTTATQLLTILDNGNIGVGTTSPGAKVHTYENAVDGGLAFRLENASAAGTTKYATLGQMGSNGYGITGWASATVLEGTGDGGLTLSSYAGDLRLQTGSGRATRMTINNSTGYVGIGTTTPSEALTVSGRVAISGVQPLIGITDTDASYKRSWFMQAYGNVFRLYDGTAGAERLTVDSSGNITLNGLRMNGADVNNTIYQASGAMGITTTAGNAVNIGDTTNYSTLRVLSGKVGIGVSPTFYKFDVQGTSRFAGNVLIETSEDPNAFVVNSSAQGGYLFRIDGETGNIITDEAGIGAKFGIGATNPESKLQIGNPYAGDSIGSVPIVRVLGSPLNTTSETLLRLNRPLNSGAHYSGGLDVNLFSYNPSGCGDGCSPKTQVNFALKSSTSNTETANINVLTLRDNGNVGIGTTSPLSALHVVGTISDAPTGQGVHMGMSSSYAAMQFYGASGSFIDFSDASGEDADFRIMQSSATAFQIGATGSASGLTVSNAGYVGVGNTAPLRLLQVGAGIPSSIDVTNIKLAVLTGMAVANTTGRAIYSYMPEGASNGTIEAYNYASSTGMNLLINPNGGNVGIGGFASGGKLSVINGTGSGVINYLKLSYDTSGTADYTIGRNTVTGFLEFTGNQAPYIGYTFNGKVGIGTTTPSTALEVNGDMSFSAGANRVISMAGTSGGYSLSMIGHPNTGSGFGGNINITGGAAANVGGALNLSGGPSTSQSLGGLVNIFGGSSPVAGSSSKGGNVYIHGGYGANGHGNVILAFSTSSAPLGNVGIGTSTPNSSLTVTGITTIEGYNNVGALNIKAGTGQGSAYLLNITYNNASPLMTLLSGAAASLDVSAPVRSLAGSTTTPSFSFINDSDTGMFNPAANVLSFGTNAGERLRIDASGNVGIGTTTSAIKLSVIGSAQFTGVTSGTYANDLNLTSAGILTTSASDRRLKDDITELATSTLAKILDLKTYTFTWKDDPTKRLDVGMIAQEVEEIFPEITFTNEVDGYKGINYSRITTLLVKGIQEQQVQLDELKKYAVFIRTKELHTEKLCVGDEADEVCVTKEELRAVLRNAMQNGVSGGGSPAPTPTPAPEPTPTPSDEGTGGEAAADGGSNGGEAVSDSGGGEAAPAGEPAV